MVLPRRLNFPGDTVVLHDRRVRYRGLHTRYDIIALTVYWMVIFSDLFCRRARGHSLK